MIWKAAAALSVLRCMAALLFYDLEGRDCPSLPLWRRDMNDMKEMKNGPYRSRFCLFCPAATGTLPCLPNVNDIDGLFADGTIHRDRACKKRHTKRQSE